MNNLRLNKDLRLWQWTFGLTIFSSSQSNKGCWLTFQCSIFIEKTALQMNLELSVGGGLNLDLDTFGLIISTFQEIDFA